VVAQQLLHQAGRHRQLLGASGEKIIRHDRSPLLSLPFLTSHYE
jgi:hypothetical protein